MAVICAPGSISASSTVWSPGPQAMSRMRGGPGSGAASARARAAHARLPGPSRGSPWWIAKKISRWRGSLKSIPGWVWGRSYSAPAIIRA